MGSWPLLPTVNSPLSVQKAGEGLLRREPGDAARVAGRCFSCGGKFGAARSRWSVITESAFIREAVESAPSGKFRDARPVPCP